MYDYIIVGGGSAGCVLANRLSEDPNCKVCVLEAGPPDKSIFIRIPFLFFMLLRGKRFNWHYFTIPQKNCDKRKLYWPRGKTLGGSSAINAMCYTRGDVAIFDEWQQLGINGWSSQEMVPYYRQVEANLSVASARYRNPLVGAFIAAAKECGYSERTNLDSSDQEGVGYYNVTQKNGARCSNAVAYLHPIEMRPNLTVITNAQATKILFQHKRAVGVRYKQGKRDIDINANREVIICSGTIGSPQLLLLSGIGKAAELSRFGISTVQELPGVGENLQDHIDIHICDLEKTHEAISFRPATLYRLLTGWFNYLVFKKGLFTCNIAQAGGFIKSDATQKRPDLQWHFLPTMPTLHGLNLKPVFKHYGYTLKTTVLNPKSRGRISLQHVDPLAPPAIDPNYFADPADMERLLAGFKKARAVLDAAAFVPYKLQEFEPDQYTKVDIQIREYITAAAETVYHPVGTCKMGNDEMAVVDEQLKVRGLLCLRVVDASVIPIIPAGNTNATVTAIAEKAADMIKAKK